MSEGSSSAPLSPQPAGGKAGAALLMVVPLLVVLAVAAWDRSRPPEAPPAKDPYTPLEVLEDPPIQEHATEPAARPLRTPLPEPRTLVPGDGWPGLATALAAVQSPSAAIRAQLERDAKDPAGKLEPLAQEQVRALWPAIRALAEASRHERILPPAGADLQSLRDVSLSALVLGRIEGGADAHALGADRATHVIGLGRGLAHAPDPIHAATGAALSRLGRAWIERSLSANAWTSAELEWLAAALQREASAWPKPAEPRAPARNETRTIDAEGAVARELAEESAALADFAARIDARCKGRDGR